MTMNFLSDFLRSKQAVLKVIKIINEGEKSSHVCSNNIYNLSMILVWTVACSYWLPRVNINQINGYEVEKDNFYYST